MLPRTEGIADADISFETLYANYQQPVLIYLVRMVSDREAAEDLCQETFIKVLRHWDGRNPDSSLASWLYRIATNTAYDYLRRRRRIRFSSLYDSEFLPANDHSMESRLDEGEPVQTALLQLPSIYRVPLVLHSYVGQSTQEIADSLGCSNSAVKTRLYRARERFREVYRA